MKCNSCEMLAINNVPCHEQGCPEAWKTSTVECKWCGFEFTPEERGQVYCEDSCANSALGLDDGQPSEYDEWQDYMGGDDWDHGQYDMGEY